MVIGVALSPNGTIGDSLLEDKMIGIVSIGGVPVITLFGCDFNQFKMSNM